MPTDEPTARTIERRVHAKINLALSVGPAIGPGRPGAGMHPICSWMACIDLCDTLETRRLEAGEASVFDIARDDGRPAPWAIPDDLAARAHALLEAHAGRALPVHATLRKSIPDGAGLGGGSADAAAMLQALDALYSLGLGSAGLARLSRTLGSDIAFFLDDASPARPAVVSGLGERVERVAPTAGELVLICPAFGCETGPVYHAYDEAPAPLREAEIAHLARSGRLDAGALFNDLAPAAERTRPGLGELRARLATALGAPVHMSGSGSTLFVVGGAGLAQSAAAAAPDCRVFRTRLL